MIHFNIWRFTIVRRVLQNLQSTTIQSWKPFKGWGDTLQKFKGPETPLAPPRNIPPKCRGKKHQTCEWKLLPKSWNHRKIWERERELPLTTPNFTSKNHRLIGKKNPRNRKAQPGQVFCWQHLWRPPCKPGGVMGGQRLGGSTGPVI